MLNSNLLVAQTHIYSISIDFPETNSFVQDTIINSSFYGDCNGPMAFSIRTKHNRYFSVPFDELLLIDLNNPAKKDTIRKILCGGFLTHSFFKTLNGNYELCYTPKNNLYKTINAQIHIDSKKDSRRLLIVHIGNNSLNHTYKIISDYPLKKKHLNRLKNNLLDYEGIEGLKYPRDFAFEDEIFDKHGNPLPLRTVRVEMLK